MKKRHQFKWRKEITRRRPLDASVETFTPEAARAALETMPGPLRVPLDRTFCDLYVRAVIQAGGRVTRSNEVVALADIVPHDPPSVDRIRLFLTQENPSALGTAAELIRRGAAFSLYQDAAGRLIMCDNYPMFVAAHELGVTEVHAVVYRETP